MAKFWTSLLRADRILTVVILLLFTFGATIQYSLGLGASDTGLPLFVKQILFFCVGFAAYAFLLTVDYRLWQPLYRWFYLLILLLLLALFTPFGEVIRGVRSWLDFGFFIWQPVEFVKVFLILVLAAYFCKQGRHLRTGKPLIVSGAAVLVLVVLTMAQPDLGSAMILFLLWLGLVLVLGLSKWQIGLMSIGFIAVAIFGWFFLLKDYQRDRLLTFLDRERDPLVTGYNLTQSIIAIGSGQWAGRGIGFGSQSQLRFLPESNADFVFAVVGEELGFAGVLLLLTLYGLVAWRLCAIALGTRNDFGQIIAVGVLITVLGQAAVHICMNMGLLPVTGLSLPFISSGGSYLLAVMMMMGLAQSVSVHS